MASRLLPRITLTALLVILPVSLSGQSDRGSITGTVKDTSGAAIPAVAVKAIQTGTNFMREGATTETGKYVIPELPAGDYTLVVTKSGFKTYNQSGITVAVSQASTVDVVLNVGQLSETIEVRANATLLRVENAEVSTTISNDRINRLPLDFNGAIRNPMGFIRIVPGAVVSRDSSWPVTSQNGLQSFTEEIRVDGATGTNPTPGVFNEVQPSTDAIQEFNVQTSSFNAEYGQAGGAIFNFTMRSGTNELHGSAYEYMRNEFMNARNKDLEPGMPKSKQRRHDFGGTLGGPVLFPKLYNGRNRTFWFTSYEQFYTRDNQQGFYSVPRDEWRTGDLSSLLLPTILGTDILGRQIRQGQLYDPATTRTVLVNGQSYVVRDPFPNNQVPLRSSVAQKVLSFLPKASTPGLDTDNLMGITGNPLRDTAIWSLKLDHDLSSKNRLSGMFNYMFTHKINGATPFGAADPARDQTITSKMIRINHDYTLSPTAINHLAIGLLRYQNPDGVPDRGFDPAQELGLKGTMISGWFPSISFGSNNLTAIGTNQLKHLWHTVPTITESFSKVMGAHTLKFGAEYRKVMANFFGANNAYGSLTFSSRQTALPSESANSVVYSGIGNAFASFLLGDVDTASMNSPISAAYRSSDYSFYAQDDFKINSRLTVNYGLRYDLHRPLTEKYDRISSFVPDLPNPGAGGRPGALGFLGSGSGRVGRHSWLDTDFRDLGPRIGAAYRLTNKTVLRGGFGVVYGRLEINTFDPIQAVGSGSVSTAYPPIDNITQSLFSLDNGFPPVNIRPPVLDPTLLNNQSISAFSPDSGKLPRIYNWNFTIQREITPNLTIEAAYVGNRGTRLIGGFLRNLNQNDYSVLSMGDKLSRQINNAADAAALGVAYPYPGFTGTVAQALRPYPQYQGIFDPQATVGESNYNSLQVTATQRLSHGLDFLVAYTLSKNITTVDDAFGWGGYGILGAVDTKKLSLDRGLAVDAVFTNNSRGDRTHNLVASFGYELPFESYVRNKVAKKIVGGWRIAGILQYQSGVALPLSPFWPNNLSNTIFNNEGRYDIVSGQPIRNQVSNPWPGVSWMFNPNAFRDPEPYRLGNAARTYGDLRGFPYLNEDLALSKQVRITERKQLQLRVDAFNVFNRSIWNDPSTAVYDPSRIQNGRAIGYGSFWGRANLERQMQAQLRFIF